MGRRGLFRWMRFCWRRCFCSCRRGRFGRLPLAGNNARNMRPVSILVIERSAAVHRKILVPFGVLIDVMVFAKVLMILLYSRIHDSPSDSLPPGGKRILCRVGFYRGDGSCDGRGNFEIGPYAKDGAKFCGIYL